MTNLSSHIAVGDASATTDIARSALEIAIGVAIVAALAGAWLILVSFVPFDLRVH